MSNLSLKKLSEVEFSLRVLFGRTLIDLPSLSNLQIGDVVKLDQLLTEPFSFFIEDKESFKVWPGSCNGHKAIHIKGE